jgi:signal transduction histidine kinase
MNPAAAEIEERWRCWLIDRNRRGLRIGLFFGLTLYPAFGVLDWLVAPREALVGLWATRALVAVMAAVLLRILPTGLFDGHWELLTASYAWLGAAGISSMTLFTGGLASPYYAGIILVVLAVGLLFVWRPAVVVLTHGAIVGFFLLVNLLDGVDLHIPAIYSNLAFLTATAIIASMGQVLAFHGQRDQLAQRVRLERATANLERAHAELQQLDQFKSRFFANMTHELRTPLAMVLTPLELVLDGEMGEVTEAQRSAFQTMFRSALKLLKLINDLLDLSRIEESRLRLRLVESDLVEQLRALVEQTQVLAQRKAIKLGFQSEVARASIWCDPERLERVFVNLLSNAVKFTPSGGRVKVLLRDLIEVVEVEVEDDGPGFPPDKAEAIFERFYQVDMGGTRQHGGAGIGLSLARELVLLHGGTIRARSDGRSGAHFAVTLPKVARQARSSETESSTPAGSEEAELEIGLGSVVQLTARREFRLLDIEEATERRVVERDLDEETRPHTALVVEDNPHIIRLVHVTLRRQFKVLTALDGLQGLEMARSQLPNLVVTDLMMPGIDGLELTRRLREDPHTCQIPVLMLTARGDVDDRVKGLEVGVNAYLVKPFSPKELLTCARQLVQAEEQTADLVLNKRMESLQIVTAGLAHEMNNPLNYVRNALAGARLDAERAMALAAQAATRALEPEERVELARLADRLRRMHDVADSGLRRIGGTVDLMRRYARAGFRRTLVRHDAWDAVRTVVGLVLPATGREVEVELDLHGDGALECVPEEFNQVLTNLVQNAIEAAPDGGGRVRVRGQVEGETLVLAVKDNGPGVKPELREQLFTPFFTTKGPGHGMGMGLTIARRVVQSLGGTLQLAGSAEAGAEFVVRVARCRSQPAAGGTAPAGASPPE